MLKFIKDVQGLEKMKKDLKNEHEQVFKDTSKIIRLEDDIAYHTKKIDNDRMIASDFSIFNYMIDTEIDITDMDIKELNVIQVNWGYRGIWFITDKIEDDIEAIFTVVAERFGDELDSIEEDDTEDTFTIFDTKVLHHGGMLGITTL